MGRIGLPELVIILVIILILFGGAKIPEIARGLGQGIKEFKKASKEDPDGVKKEGSGEKKNA
ncbi:MAG: twin-arginine translocase TatA/TatE family subunit [Deltaproteobacteria bacterium]